MPDPKTSPAGQLEGLDLDGGWHVLAMVTRPAGSTGGTFSICYDVENRDPTSPHFGERGFLKALDFAPVVSAPDPPRMLQALTEAFNYERDLVDACTSRRMRHVVAGRGSGIVTVSGFGPLLDRVSYLLFEAADRDVRGTLALVGTLDAAWIFRTLHNVANGLRQMHQAGVAHQDLKPSNVLDFGDERKIADLGRASLDGIIAPHDGLAVAGAIAYAPPEQLYGYLVSDERVRRRACDLYHLGSLLCFFFRQQSVTPGLAGALDPSHLPGAFGGTYDDVLPMLRVAYAQVAGDLESAIPEEFRKDAIQVFSELCDPDVRGRGVPSAPSLSISRMQLDRYVSKFDRLNRIAEASVRKALD